MIGWLSFARRRVLAVLLRAEADLSMQGKGMWPARAAVLLTFLFLAATVAAVALKYQAAPGLTLSVGDAIQHSVCMKVADDPALFAADGLMSDPAPCRSVTGRTLYTLLARAALHFVDDYPFATAAVALLERPLFLAAAFLFLRFLGLGRVSSALGALAFLPTVQAVNEYIGLSDAPLPRTLFEAVSYLLVAAAIIVKRRPHLWPVLYLIVGAAGIVHMLSAAIHLAALAIFHGTQVLLGAVDRRRGTVLLGMAGLFGGGALLGVNAFAHGIGGAIRSFADPAAYLQAVMYRHSPLLVLPGAVAEAMVREWGLPTALVVVLVFLVRRFAPQYAERYGDALAIAAAFAAVALAVPVAEMVAKPLVGGTPILFQFLRGVRYADAVLRGLGIAALLTLAETAGLALLGQMAFAAVGIVLVMRSPDSRYVAAAALCRTTGTDCAAAVSVDRDYVAMARRTVPAGTPVFGIGIDYPLRVLAGLPVVWESKGAGILAWTRPDKFIAWWRTAQDMDSLERMPEGPERLKRTVDRACGMGARYLFVLRGWAWGTPQGRQALTAVLGQPTAVHPDGAIFALSCPGERP